MATRSAIAVMHGDRVKSIYCHWDGYPEGVGSVLVNHYDSVKANHLVALGDVSSLGPEIGEQHPFSRLDTELSQDAWDDLYGNWTTFYGRDREETGTEFRSFASLDEYVAHYEGMGCDYFYVITDGAWQYTVGADKPWRDLVNALINPGQAAA